MDAVYIERLELSDASIIVFIANANANANLQQLFLGGLLWKIENKQEVKQARLKITHKTRHEDISESLESCEKCSKFHIWCSY